MRRTRNIAVASSGLAIAVLAAIWLSGLGRPEEWAPPVTLDGRYDARYAMTFGRGGTAEGATSLSVGLQGKLDVRALPSASSSERLLAAKLTVEKVDADEAAKKLTGFGTPGSEAALAEPWLIVLDEAGRVTEVRFDEQLPIAARGVFASIAFGTQLARPRGSERATWTADERETNGSYGATYEASWTGGAVTKRWSIGNGGTPEDPGQLDPYEGRGEATFEVGKTSIERVTSTMRGTVNVGGQRMEDRGRYESTTALVRTAEQAAPLAPAFDPARLVAFSVSQVPPQKVPVAEGETFDTLLEEARIAGNEKDWQRRTIARTELTRMVAADDRLAKRTATMIRAGGHSEPVERTLIEALVGAASPAAQGETAAMITDDAMAHETRLRLLQAVSLLRYPGQEILRSLEDTAFAAKDAVYASEAAITLGASVGHLRADDPRLAQATAEKMLARAEAVVSPTLPVPGMPAAPGPNASLAERTNWIGALGNAGLPESLPLLTALLGDPEPMIRSSAAHSLRFLDPADALPVMQRAMRDDKSITVRHALLHAARVMGPALMEDFVTRALMFDRSEHVRLGAAYTIAFWATKAPGLRRTLAEALAQEKSAKVRESLRNYLQPGRTEYPFRRVEDPGSAP